MIVLSTGMGKTATAGMIISEFPKRINSKGNVLWLTHEESLINQSAESVVKIINAEKREVISDVIEKFGGVIEVCSAKESLFVENHEGFFTLRGTVGIIKQQLFEIGRTLTVASVQTIVNRLDRIPKDHFDIIIVDECHLCMSRSWQNVINHFTPKLLLGLTATPERLDGLSLDNIFDEKVIEKDIKFGIDNGYLCELDAVLLKTNISLNAVKKTAGEFNQKDLQIVDCDERNDQIVQRWKQVAHGRPTLAFCVDVQHAIHLSERFQKEGIRSTYIVADPILCPDRKQRTRDFKAGKYDVVCNVAIFAAGFDYPDIGCTISAAPTMSRTKFLQGPVGRGTRIKSETFVQKFGKNNCIIIDVTDNSDRHELVNTATLDSGKRFEEQVFLTKEKREELIRQRELRYLEHNRLHDERRNLLSPPEIKFKTDEPWMKLDATEAQIALLKKYGVHEEGNNYSRGHASELISKTRVTDQWKLRQLRDAGYDVSVAWTFAQYNKAMDDIQVKKSRDKFRDKAKRNPFLGVK